jgi:hypothetical protein
MKSQYNSHGENGEKAFNNTKEIEIRGIQNKISRVIVASKFCREAASEASAVNDHVSLTVLGRKLLIDELHISEHFLFATFAGALSKASVIKQHYVVIVPVKVFSISRPPFYTSAVSVEVQYQTFWLIAIKMKAINPNARFNIEEILPERNIIFESEILLQFLWLKY